MANAGAVFGARRGSAWPAFSSFRLRLANAEATNRLVDKLVGLAFVQCEERDGHRSAERTGLGIPPRNGQDDLLITGDGDVGFAIEVDPVECRLMEPLRKAAEDADGGDNWTGRQRHREC